MRRIVVVGASLAGLRTGESLRRAGFEGDLMIVGAEAHLPYDRPPLSKGFMSGRVGGEALALRRSPALAAEWVLGRRAVRVDGNGKMVHLCDGTRLPYDGLVIATGATPLALPQIPTSAVGIHTLRTIDDAVALRRELLGSPRVVIVGGGFIGSELASTCRELGREVTVVTPIPLLATALGPLGPAATARARDHGVRVIEKAVAGVDVGDRVTGVRLNDDAALPADIVVVAVGAAPETRWLEGSGAELDRGVVCDDTLAVQGLSDTVAAGDVVRWPHPALAGELLRVEHWTNAAEQASAAAKRLLLGPGPRFAAVPSFWSDQFGVRLQGVGFPGLADAVTVVDGDASGGYFVAEYRRAGQLVGAVVAAAATALLPYRREIAQLALAPS